MKTDLFTIKPVEDISDGSMQYSAELNPDSVIYRAHFPQEPITPGVCLLQMVSACVEDALGRVAVLDSARNVKFLAVVSPREVTSMTVRLEISGDDGEGCSVKASLTAGETVYAKMSLRYVYA